MGNPIPRWLWPWVRTPQQHEPSLHGGVCLASPLLRSPALAHAAWPGWGTDSGGGIPKIHPRQCQMFTRIRSNLERLPSPGSSATGRMPPKHQSRLQSCPTLTHPTQEPLSSWIPTSQSPSCGMRQREMEGRISSAFSRSCSSAGEHNGHHGGGAVNAGTVHHAGHRRLPVQASAERGAGCLRERPLQPHHLQSQRIRREEHPGVGHGDERAARLTAGGMLGTGTWGGGRMESITHAIPTAHGAGAAVGPLQQGRERGWGRGRGPARWARGGSWGPSCPAGHCRHFRAHPQLPGVCLQQPWRQFQG